MFLIYYNNILKIHISSTCVFEELNGHPVHQDSSLSTFQRHSPAHVPDLAVSYSHTTLKLSELRMYLVTLLSSLP